MSTWTKPRTDTAAWSRAVLIAKRLDLSLNVAKNERGAAKYGNYWVFDLSLHEHGGRADNVEELLEILQRYETERPNGRPQPTPQHEPWPDRVRRWWTRARNDPTHDPVLKKRISTPRTTP